MATAIEPKSPGETLRELLQQRGLSQKAFSKLAGISQGYVSDLCRDARPISAATALILERTLGVMRAEMWLQLEADRRLREARREEGAA